MSQEQTHASQGLPHHHHHHHHHVAEELLLRASSIPHVSAALDASGECDFDGGDFAVGSSSPAFSGMDIVLAFDGRILNNKLLKLEHRSGGAIHRRYRGVFELETLNMWMDFEGAISDGDRSGDNANTPSRNHTWDYFNLAWDPMAVRMGFRLAMSVSG
eukprot:scaffold21040_cov41-Cyclotella_meneghiniana.AAC.1